MAGRVVGWPVTLRIAPWAGSAGRRWPATRQVGLQHLAVDRCGVNSVWQCWQVVIRAPIEKKEAGRRFHDDGPLSIRPEISVNGRRCD